MPILGEGRKYQIERASKERPARSKPLERQRPTWVETVQVFCLVVLMVLVVFGAAWLFVATTSHP